jgi:Bacterial sugar transferase
MGKLITSAAGFFGSLLSRLFADQIAASIPWLIEHFLQRAIDRLPSEQRERYSEEWRSHINDVPGDLGKLVSSLGCLLAAGRIASDVHARPALKLFIRALDISVAALVLLLQAPLLLVVAALLKLTGSGKVFARARRVGQDGTTFWMYRFQVNRSTQPNASGFGAKRRPTRIGIWLRRTNIHMLPTLINVLRGDMSLVGPAAFRPYMQSSPLNPPKSQNPPSTLD